MFTVTSLCNNTAIAGGDCRPCPSFTCSAGALIRGSARVASRATPVPAAQQREPGPGSSHTHGRCQPRSASPGRRPCRSPQRRDCSSRQAARAPRSGPRPARTTAPGVPRRPQGSPGWAGRGSGGGRSCRLPRGALPATPGAGEVPAVCDVSLRQCGQARPPYSARETGCCAAIWRGGRR